MSEPAERMTISEVERQIKVFADEYRAELRSIMDSHPHWHEGVARVELTLRRELGHTVRKVFLGLVE